MSRLERLLLIHALIAGNRQPTVDDLCQRCETSRRTILADIAYLRLYLDAPIRYHRLRGYTYDRPYTLDEAARAVVPCP